MINNKRRIKRGWMPLRVEKITAENHDTKTICFVDNEDNNVPFDYKAGQYLTFRFDELEKKPIVRSYTMSSSPCQKNHIAITIKKLKQGIISNYIFNKLKVGDIFRARGPMGRFTYEPPVDFPHLVMIGAGSGITPFVSILREFSSQKEKNLNHQADLIISFRSRWDLISWETLSLLNEEPNIRVHLTLSQDETPDVTANKGRITPDFISSSIDGQYDNKTFMICGPEGLMAAASNYLKDKNVSPLHIKTESFQD